MRVPCDFPIGIYLGLCEYKRELERISGKVGVDIAYQGISTKVYDAIADMYPCEKSTSARKSKKST